MVFGRFHRLRALVLILTLALGLAGQTFAPAVMAMQSDQVAMSGTASSDSCPVCNGLDHSKAMAADCGIGLCSGVVAVLPATLPGPATHHPSFARVADNGGQGISIPPALGPPRFSHLS